jgi:hypothetical protein
VSAFSQVSRLAPSAQIVVEHFLLYLAVAVTTQLTVRVTKVEWLSAPAVPFIVMV